MCPEPDEASAGHWISLDARVVLDVSLPAAVQDTLQWDWQSPVPSGAATRQIEVKGGPLPQRPTPGETRVTVIMDVPVQSAVHGNDLWLDDALHVRVWSDRAVITVTEDVSPLLLAVAMTEAHRAAGWLPLHAALIGRPGASGAVAILGDSGAGKSTACLRLRAAGYAVMAEDRSWISPAGVVTGLDRGLRAFDDSVQLFAPEWAAQPGGPRDAKGKRLLPLIQPGSATLQALLLLSDSAVPVGARRVPLTWSATGLPLTRGARQSASGMVQRLVREVPWQAVTRGTVVSAVAAQLGSAGPDLN